MFGTHLQTASGDGRRVRVRWEMVSDSQGIRMGDGDPCTAFQSRGRSPETDALTACPLTARAPRLPSPLCIALRDVAVAALGARYFPAFGPRRPGALSPSSSSGPSAGRISPGRANNLDLEAPIALKTDTFDSLGFVWPPQKSSPSYGTSGTLHEPSGGVS